MSKSRLAVPISPFRREHYPFGYREARQLQYARSMRRKPTASEGALWAVLRSREHMGFRVKRQVVLGRYVADFVVPSVRLVVEVDGSAHYGREGADAMRTRNLEFLGYSVIGVNYSCRSATTILAGGHQVHRFSLR